MLPFKTICCLAFASYLGGADVEWPVNGGQNNIRYSPLTQIDRANVKQLEVAWTYNSGDMFIGSEMQSNPIMVDGTLYATTPKLRLIALDAATGKELWSFDPKSKDETQRKYRHGGVTVYRKTVFFTHRNNLWALDRHTGKPIVSFGDNGRVDLRQGLDRPSFLKTRSSWEAPFPKPYLALQATFAPSFHAFDKLTGKLLWEATLPAAGNATPAIYQRNGREYVVIACGGGKNEAPSGGSIVAFALPEAPGGTQ